MRAMRGEISNLAAISKVFNSIPCLSQLNKVVGSDVPLLMRLRMFSSMDGQTGSGQSRKAGFSEFNDRTSDDDDENFSGRDGVKLDARQNLAPPHPIPGRPLRGERQSSQFRGQNTNPNLNLRRQGRFDGPRKPVGGDGGRANMKLNMALGGNDEGKKDSRPSISELLNRPLKGERGNKQEGDDFLDKFKLRDDGGKKENQPDEAAKSAPIQEDKIEPPEDADVIFKRMKQTGLIPNAVAMLDGLCKDGLVQEAMKLFGLMREKGSMPEVVVYTAVVEGFCQAKKLDDAKRIFRKMQDNGIVPNAFSYAVLIKGLCKVQKLDDAVDFCVEMLEAGHSPNVATFTGLVLEFCKEKGIEEAQKIIGTLKQKGYYLDEKAVRNYLDKTGPTSPMVWEAIFGPKKTMQRGF
uniref:Pentacotripeptide-repeat region of PRORP domain-containing protein n=1 Tax=Opuntia streptacantha TaxID=393608 RepID=A0A7C8YYS6_OPUST